MLHHEIELKVGKKDGELSPVEGFELKVGRKDGELSPVEGFHLNLSIAHMRVQLHARELNRMHESLQEGIALSANFHEAIQY